MVVAWTVVTPIPSALTIHDNLTCLIAGKADVPIATFRVPPNHAKPCRQTVTAISLSPNPPLGIGEQAQGGIAQRIPPIFVHSPSIRVAKTEANRRTCMAQAEVLYARPRRLVWTTRLT